MSMGCRRAITASWSTDSETTCARRGLENVASIPKFGVTPQRPAVLIIASMQRLIPHGMGMRFIVVVERMIEFNVCQRETRAVDAELENGCNSPRRQ